MPVTMNPEIQRGRFFVTIAIVYSCVISAVIELGTASFSPVSWVLTAALFYALWRGQSWARWLWVGLTSLNPLVGLYFLRGRPSLFVIGLLLCQMPAAILLAFPASVSAFLAAQRNRPPASISPPVSREPREHVDPY